MAHGCVRVTITASGGGGAMSSDAEAHTPTGPADADADAMSVGDDVALLPAKSTDDFANILDNIMGSNADFDKEPEEIQSAQTSALPMDAFIASFARNNSEIDLADIPEKEMDHLSSLVDGGFLSPVETDEVEVASTAPAEATRKPSLRKVVSLDELAREAGLDAFGIQPVDRTPEKDHEKEKEQDRDYKTNQERLVEKGNEKGKPKERAKSKSKKTPTSEPTAPPPGEFHLPPIVGRKAAKATKPSVDPDLASKASRRHSDHRVAGSKLPVIPALNRSHEAEDIPSGHDSSTGVGVHLPKVPRSSPERVQGFQRKRHGKPLYLRMIAQAQKLIALEEQAKHEEYLRLKSLRAKGHYSREEIKQHMKQFDEVMKSKASESRNSHLAQMKALRKKNKELQDDMSHAGHGLSEVDSLESLHSSPAARAKHQRQAEAYDSIEYKMDEDARERKMKYKKLQEIVTPKKPRGKMRHHRSPAVGMGGEGPLPSPSPRAVLSPRTKESLAKKQALGGREHEGEDAVVQPAESPVPSARRSLDEDLDLGLDLEADSISRLIAVTSPSAGEGAVATAAEKDTATDPPTAPMPALTPVPVEVDPFADLAPSSSLDIDSKDIPTFLAQDWMQILHAESDEVQACLA